MIDGTIGVLTRDGQSCDELNHWIENQLRDSRYRLAVRRMKGNQIAAQRNRVANQMFGDFLLFVDADVVPPLDAIEKLLAPGLPIVGSVITQRFPPFEVCATKALEPWTLYTRADLPSDGIVPAVACGTGCLLIRRPVFEALDYPWFRCGELDPEYLTEDTAFGLRAAERGFATWIHCGVRPKHATRALVYLGADGELWVDWPGPVHQPQRLRDVRSVTVPDGVYSADLVHAP